MRLPEFKTQEKKFYCIVMGISFTGELLRKGSPVSALQPSAGNSDPHLTIPASAIAPKGRPSRSG
jgi:hypothetical protein